jgi:predicted  nucleic acid-binding Zn-ribbon protein
MVLRKKRVLLTICLHRSVKKSRHDRMVELVERMLALHKQLTAAKIEHEKTALQRQIEATDRQIDALVYELYGLTEEEIKIVEGRNDLDDSVGVKCL